MVDRRKEVVDNRFTAFKQSLSDPFWTFDPKHELTLAQVRDEKVFPTGTFVDKKHGGYFWTYCLTECYK